MVCASDTTEWSRVTREQRKASIRAFNRALRQLAKAFSNGRFERRPESIPREVITALLYEAGDIAESERTGTMTTQQANAALWRLARRGFRRYGNEKRVRWGCSLPKREGQPLIPHPINPDAEFLVRFAFWRCATVVDIREWRRFTLRKCQVAGCENLFVEARTELRGGETKRCPSCRAEQKKTPFKRSKR